MLNVLFGILLGLVIAGIIGGGIHMQKQEDEIDDLHSDIASLISDNHSLAARVTELEETQAKRLPHDAAAAIEDSIASLVNAQRLHNALKTDADALEHWLGKAAEFGRYARGAKGYDADEPTGNARRS